MHDGTVRDICFIEDSSNKSSLLISGGAGDCKIYVTDCVTGTPFQALSGHTGNLCVFKFAIRYGVGSYYTPMWLNLYHENTFR